MLKIGGKAFSDLEPRALSAPSLCALCAMFSDLFLYNHGIVPTLSQHDGDTTMSSESGSLTKQACQDEVIQIDPDESQGTV